MSKYLRISNRGLCPRAYILILGATTKRDMFEDPSQGGWFGSGTIYAPVAAHALGVEVHFTSEDSEGPYRFTYGTKSVPGEKGEIQMMAIRTSGGEEIITMLSKDAGMNWSQPIGDDTMRSYRVVREYLRNAKDEDADAPYLHYVKHPHDARKGRTDVFLTATEEIQHMMKYPARYFKYISKVQPLHVVDGYGAIYPKSEKGATRLFSLKDASLAYCSKDGNDSSLFDYTFFDKKLMTEERVFGDMTRVYRALGHMLSQVDNAELLSKLLTAMVKGEAVTELRALSYIHNTEDIICREVWLEAWKAIYGENAIIATGNVEEDRLAGSQAKKNPVILQSDVLKKFFALCGVQNSRAFIPLANEPGYEIVEPSDFEKQRLETVLAAIHEEYPETRGIPVHVFVHTDSKWNLNGFAGSDSGNAPYTDVYIHKNRLSLSTFGTVKTLLHEFTHVISGDMHGMLFISVDDCQRALLFMLKKGLPHDGVEPLDLDQYRKLLKEMQLRASGLDETQIALKNVMDISKDIAKKQGGE